MRANKLPVPTEAQEQMTLFSWAAMQSGKYPELNLLYHVPNGGSRHKAEAGRLRAEGVKAGVPDLCLPVARGQYHGLYIELKRQRGGRTSDHQSEWLDALSAQGYKAALCYGWEQAAGTIIAEVAHMTKKQTELSEELREAVFEAARAGAAEAYTQNTGYVNYFKAMETLLYNYKKLAALVADEEAYCEVEYHAGRKTFSTTPQAKGFIQRKTEAEIVEEMREEKQKQFKETKSGFDSLTRAISLFEGHKEFVVIRLYYFGEDINGNPREGGTATWEEIAEELSDAGILKEIKTARRWRNKIVNDMAVCVFGIPAAVSAATYRKAVDK